MRRIDFEGCFNFRDLGGWRTYDEKAIRWGQLYRADAVHLMSAADVRRASDEIGIRTLIDLRSDPEIETGGMGTLAEKVLARHHAPFTSRREPVAVDATTAAAASFDRSPEAMAEYSLAVLEVSSDIVVDAVEALAAPDALPAVFFCAAGKDRTGILSAVVLGAIGVRDEDIIEDYILSGESIDEIIGRFGATEGAPAMYREFPASHFAPHAETMERVIGSVRSTYGSFADYLESKGLPAPSFEVLRSSLLEPAS